MISLHAPRDLADLACILRVRRIAGLLQLAHEAFGIATGIDGRLVTIAVLKKADEVIEALLEGGIGTEPSTCLTARPFTYSVVRAMADSPLQLVALMPKRLWLLLPSFCLIIDLPHPVSSAA